MNRYNLRLKLVDILDKYSKYPANSNHYRRDKVLYSRLYRMFQLKPPGSCNKMRKALGVWVNGDLSRKSLIDLTFATYQKQQTPKLKTLLRNKSLDTEECEDKLLICNLPSNKFYYTKDWRELRYNALTRYGNKCSCCGAAPENGAVLHVGHIKPRSIYPEYALNIDNLQVLCEDCNVEKSNKDDTQWR